MPLPYTTLANSISSNYSVLVHCNVPANKLKCAGAGCSALPASLALPFACTLWWQPNVTALTSLTKETMTGGQGCTSASSIYHPDDFFFFFTSPFLLFPKDRQGKHPYILCFRLAWDRWKIQQNKYSQCLKVDSGPFSLTPPHPPGKYSEKWTIVLFTEHFFWLMGVWFPPPCQTLVNRNAF